MAKADFEQLKTAMLAQKKAYDTLLKLADEKRQALTDRDTEKLDSVVAAEDSLLSDITRLEEDRHAIVAAVAREQGLKLEDLTLRNWPGLSEAQRRDMETFQETFLETLQDIDMKNQVNSKLLQMQLGYVQQMMHDVASIQESESYSKDGDKTKRKTQENRLIDAIL